MLSIALRSISDVPLGVLLSGVLDSSSVAASLANQKLDLRSGYTVAFDNEADDESPLARDVANKWGFESRSLTVKHHELYEALLEASWLHDEPLVHHQDAHLVQCAHTARLHQGRPFGALAEPSTLEIKS